MSPVVFIEFLEKNLNEIKIIFFLFFSFFCLLFFGVDYDNKYKGSKEIKTMNTKLIKLNGTEIKPNLKNIKLELSKTGINKYSKIEYICESKSFVWAGSTKLWMVDGTNVRFEWTIKKCEINQTAKEILQYIKNDFREIKNQLKK
jgi:hypothetical protein